MHTRKEERRKKNTERSDKNKTENEGKKENKLVTPPHYRPAEYHEESYRLPNPESYIGQAWAKVMRI